LDFAKCFENRYIDNRKVTQSVTESQALNGTAELRSSIKKSGDNLLSGEKVTGIIEREETISSFYTS
jgi:hypothetical protein